MLITSLPFLLRLGGAHACNPVAIGFVWTFAGGAAVFAYQSAILVMGYSYGYFDAKDLIKVGAVLTIVEGILLVVLVPLYWPLIGLNWMTH
jgi:di/tricarboxylate transporter